ncbi:MAG TPA: MBL fold metallo-hydrolase, partial [Candidatus Limnocylindrales bacterium]
MHIRFLGGATTVTGSQFLLETARARVLIDCGMFQGSPNESIRNRIPFAFDPAGLDAVVLTHAHLDHCGLLPILVRDGYGGPIHATAGTIELATLVLLDSGKLHEQFAKRNARWEARNPDKAAAEDREEADAYQAALDAASAAESSAREAIGIHVATTVVPAPPSPDPTTSWPRDPE